MKRLLAVSLAANLFLTPMAAHAQPSSYSQLYYPDQNLPDQGGRLGVQVEQQQYMQNGIVYLKVTSVMPGSPLSGVLASGDFIYGVNGYNLRGYQDLITAIHSSGSGYSEKIYFLDSRDNFRAKYATVTALSNAELRQASTSGKPYCEDHPWVCVAGVVVVGIAIASIFSKPDSGASSSSPSQGGGSAYDGKSWQEQQRDADEERRAEEQRRQKKSSSSSAAAKPDNSIGCAWGDRDWETCH